MKNRLSLLLCLGFLLITDGVSLANPSARVKRSQVLCDEPVGRIIEKGIQQSLAKTLICAEEKIQIPKNTKVKFLCFSSGDIISLSSGVIPSTKCARVNTSATRANAP